MSLKHFHIFFILSALALMVFLGIWSGSERPILAAVSWTGLAAGVPYLGWFLRKQFRFLS